MKTSMSKGEFRIKLGEIIAESVYLMMADNEVPASENEMLLMQDCEHIADAMMNVLNVQFIASNNDDESLLMLINPVNSVADLLLGPPMN